MEDVLDLYQPEYNPERPVVCFDETSRQLTGEVRPPIEAAPGRVARYDTEYQRNGTPEPVHDLRAEGWMETCGGDRAPHCRGLRAPDAVAGELRLARALLSKLARRFMSVSIAASRVPLPQARSTILCAD